MDIKSWSDAEIHATIFNLKHELYKRGYEEEKPSNKKELTILTAPGFVSNETNYLIEDQYEDDDAVVLTDGVTLKEGDLINGVRHFYIMTPGKVSETICKLMVKRVKKALKRSGFKDFKVLLLPEGLTPKVII